MRYVEGLSMNLSLVLVLMMSPISHMCFLETYLSLNQLYIMKVGESFRYQYPRFVVPSYIIAGIYCTADAASDVYTVLSEDDEETDTITINNNRSKEVRAAFAGVDTLLWQGLASIAIPGGVINGIVRASRFAVARTPGLPLLATKWLPTMAGLGSIPFIITPIDDAVDYALDNSTRKVLGIKD